MAFPILSSQQETNRKILEDLQLKKQLLQKGVSPVVGAIPNFGTTQGFGPPGITQLMPASNQLLPIQSTENSINPTARTAFNQAIQSFGFFIPQDSCFGNSILPVLPRLESSTVIPQSK